MRHFVFDEDTGRFVEVRSGADLLVRPADPEPDDMRPMTEREAIERLKRMRNDPTLPCYYTWPRTHRVQ